MATESRLTTLPFAFLPTVRGTETTERLITVPAGVGGGGVDGPTSVGGVLEIVTELPPFFFFFFLSSATLPDTRPTVSTRASASKPITTRRDLLVFIREIPPDLVVPEDLEIPYPRVLRLMLTLCASPGAAQPDSPGKAPLQPRRQTGV